MEKYRAIPEKYLTVGEVAKKMDVTVQDNKIWNICAQTKAKEQSSSGRKVSPWMLLYEFRIMESCVESNNSCIRCFARSGDWYALQNEKS